MRIGGLQKSELVAVKEFSARLRDKCPRDVSSLKLFGSKARGDSHKKSDVDILVLVKRNLSGVNDAIIDIVCDVLNEYEVYIETVTMTSENYKLVVKKQYPFVINVARDAIEL